MESNGRTKYETLTGETLSEVQYAKKDGKQAWALFRLKATKGGIWLVKCFGAEAEKARDELTNLHTVVSCHGYCDKNEGTVFIAQFLAREEEAKAVGGVIKAYGTRERYHAEVAAHEKRQADKGLVKTKRSDGVILFKRKEECLLFSNGEWKDKLEFVMDVLGGERISKECRSLFSLALSKDNAGRYRAWLKERVKEACELVGWA